MQEHATIKSIRNKFDKLTVRWRADTMMSSNPREIWEHEAYQKIITMGDVVVPWMLADMRNNANTHGMWSEALRQITGVNPVPHGMCFSAVQTRLWVNWGMESGLIGPDLFFLIREHLVDEGYHLEYELYNDEVAINVISRYNSVVGIYNNRIFVRRHSTHRAWRDSDRYLDPIDPNCFQELSSIIKYNMEF